MNITYESGKALKFAEEDNWEEGCLPGTEQSYIVDVQFSADTLPALIAKIQEYHGAKKEDLLINSCDEDGRLDVQIMENGDGYEATPKEVEAWKGGMVKLYLACYTYNIKKVQRETVRL